MTDKVYNFSAGPAMLPEEVMKKAAAEFVNFNNSGIGIMEASHRSTLFQEVIDSAEANIRSLMGIPNDYAVLFLQGGASLQFSMMPMNIAVEGKKALYCNTGTWSKKAIAEAKLFSDVEIVYDGAENEFTKIGDTNDWVFDQDAAYAYMCSNNTIFGTQYHFIPKTGDVPLVADMSSDIMSRKVDVSKFGMIFAGAQKNLGPSGVTLVIIRKDLAERVADSVPTMLKYSTHINANSLFNTPPTFAIYMVSLVVEWIMEKGGLDAINDINTAKSNALYEFIDNSIFYSGNVEPSDRSKMNVCFRLPEENLEAQFVKEATALGMIGLKGHRSAGGIRASIYNAMPLDGVSRLIDFMKKFESANS